MKILITGGAGFIGSHLAERLLADGHQVAIIDNLSTGSLDNIESFKDNANFHYTIGSILSRELLDKLMDGVDPVYHLAAAVGGGPAEFAGADRGLSRAARRGCGGRRADGGSPCRRVGSADYGSAQGHHRWVVEYADGLVL